MNQEDYMDLYSLKNEGWTNTEIAEELGYHPATLAEWLKAGDPPTGAAAGGERLVMTSVWRARIKALLDRCPRLLATAVQNNRMMWHVYLSELGLSDHQTAETIAQCIAIDRELRLLKSWYRQRENR